MSGILNLWRWEVVTNKFLTEIFLDPDSLVRKLTSFRLSTPHESEAVRFLHLSSKIKNQQKLVFNFTMWRWGELNPRPKTFSQEIYMLSSGLLF